MPAASFSGCCCFDDGDAGIGRKENFRNKIITASEKEPEHKSRGDEKTAAPHLRPKSSCAPVPTAKFFCSQFC